MKASRIDTRLFEGTELMVYECTSGRRTIGVGHNLDTKHSKETFLKLGLSHKDVREGKKMLTLAQVEAIFAVDYARAIADARAIVANYDEQPLIVKEILNDMAFNLGRSELSKFNAMKSIENRDYWLAAEQLKPTKWYRQVGHRSVIIYNTLKDVPSRPR